MGSENDEWGHGNERSIHRDTKATQRRDAENQNGSIIIILVGCIAYPKKEPFIIIATAQSFRHGALDSVEKMCKIKYHRRSSSANWTFTMVAVSTVSTTNKFRWFYIGKCWKPWTLVKSNWLKCYSVIVLLRCTHLKWCEKIWQRSHCILISMEMWYQSSEDNMEIRGWLHSTDFQVEHTFDAFCIFHLCEKKIFQAL